MQTLKPRLGLNFGNSLFVCGTCVFVGVPYKFQQTRGFANAFIIHDHHLTDPIAQLVAVPSNRRLWVDFPPGADICLMNIQEVCSLFIVRMLYSNLFTKKSNLTFC